jgi:CBS domain-containing protein
VPSAESVTTVLTPNGAETEGGFEMTTAREIMTTGVECAQVDETITEAARKMRDLGVGALPICGEDNRLKGMITDRDIVLNCVAEGMDTNEVKVADYAGDEVVTIGADDSIEEALSTMTRAGVRRLPVIDGHDLVGMISQADIATNLPDDKVGDLVAAISSAPADV